MIEEGVETQLQHGSGLGLLVVRWAVAQLGGEVSFDDAVEGTAVVVALPATSR